MTPTSRWGAAVLGGFMVLAAAACGGAEPSSAPTVSSSPGGSTPDVSGSLDPAEQVRRTDGVPIGVLGAPGALGQPVVVRAGDAREATEGEDFRAVRDVVGQAGLPGPRLLTLLPDGEMFAAQLDAAIPESVVDLSDVSASVGLVGADGWAPLDAPLVPLEGANPDGLYFEPQDASARGDLVLWREGSAGELGALPDLLYDDWRLVVWDRGNDERVEIAAASELNGTRQTLTASWDVAPTTDGSHVYFDSQVLADSVWRNAVIAADLSQPGSVDVVGPGRFPAAREGGGVFYVRDTTDGASQAYPSTAEVVLAIPGAKDAAPVITLDGGGSFVVTHLVASEQLIAVTMSDVAGTAPGGALAQAWIAVVDVSDGTVAAWIDSGSDDAIVSISGDTLVWGNGSGGADASMYRWRLGDAAPVRLGATPGMSRPAVAGSYVAVPLFGEPAGEGSTGAVKWRVVEWLTS